MHGLLGRSRSAPNLFSRRYLNPCAVGSVRFRSQKSRARASKSKNDNLKIVHISRDRRRHRQQRTNGRHGGGSFVSDPRGPRPLYYWAPPEEATVQEAFDLSTLGMGFTKPSQPMSKHPAVQEVLESGKITISSTEPELSPLTQDDAGVIPIATSRTTPQKPTIAPTQREEEVQPKDGTANSEVSSLTNLFDKFQTIDVVVGQEKQAQLTSDESEADDDESATIVNAETKIDGQSVADDSPSTEEDDDLILPPIVAALNVGTSPPEPNEEAEDPGETSIITKHVMTEKPPRIAADVIASDSANKESLSKEDSRTDILSSSSRWIKPARERINNQKKEQEYSAKGANNEPTEEGVRWWETNSKKETESLSKEDSSDDEDKTDIMTVDDTDSAKGSSGEPKEEGVVPWWEATTKPQDQTIKPQTNLAGEEDATIESKDADTPRLVGAAESTVGEDANKDDKDEETTKATEKSKVVKVDTAPWWNQLKK